VTSATRGSGSELTVRGWVLGSPLGVRGRDSAHCDCRGPSAARGQRTDDPRPGDRLPLSNQVGALMFWLYVEVITTLLATTEFQRDTIAAGVAAGLLLAMGLALCVKYRRWVAAAVGVISGGIGLSFVLVSARTDVVDNSLGQAYGLAVALLGGAALTAIAFIAVFIGLAKAFDRSRQERDVDEGGPAAD